MLVSYWHFPGKSISSQRWKMTKRSMLKSAWKMTGIISVNKHLLPLPFQLKEKLCSMTTTWSRATMALKRKNFLKYLKIRFVQESAGNLPELPSRPHKDLLDATVPHITYLIWSLQSCVLCLTHTLDKIGEDWRGANTWIYIVSWIRTLHQQYQYHFFNEIYNDILLSTICYWKYHLQQSTLR